MERSNGRPACDGKLSTIFSSAFYAALLRNRGKGATPSEQAREAAERAARAYFEITGRTCPYTVGTLTPSRRAMKLA